MRLTLQSQTVDDVLVIRCGGRIVAGAEVDALHSELEKQTRVPGTEVLKLRRVVLHMGDVDYIDSSGLGALIRIFGILRSAGGGLNLCQVSPAVLKALQITNLSSILSTHSSEAEAIDAFCADSSGALPKISATIVICIDVSRDLLAYLRGLLTHSGYAVHTASNLADGKAR